MQHHYAYIGNWEIPNRKARGGISIFRWDSEKGNLTYLDTVMEHINCGNFFLDREKHLLYVTDERDQLPGKFTGGGSIYTLRIDPEIGTLTQLGWTPSFGVNPSGITISPDGNWILVSNLSGSRGCTKVLRELNGEYSLTTLYDDSNLVLFRRNADGTPGKVCDIIQHYGSSVHATQTHARPHCVISDPAGKRFLVCDKGNDCIYLYRINSKDNVLRQTNHIESSHPGSGPRYGVFHPTLPVLYHNNELKAEVCLFSCGEEDSLTELDRYSLLPDDYEEKKDLPFFDIPAPADIVIDAAGQYLYSTLRVLNRLVVHRIDPETGRLTRIQNVSCGGRNPRGFCLTPDGRHALVANLDSKEVAVFLVAGDGTLHDTGGRVFAHSPAVIRFF